MPQIVSALPLVGLLLFVFQAGSALACPPDHSSCGDACYRPEEYECFDGKDLCSKGNQRCGDACYSPDQYRCESGKLVWGAGRSPDAPGNKPPTVEDPNANGYKLVWSDDFSGDKLNPSKWDTEINCWGGGNGEKQCYVDHPDTIFVKDGLLHIRAKSTAGGYTLSEQERRRCTLNNENSCSWWQPAKSGRVRTRNSPSGSWRYGRFLVRAKLPRGNFLWPAIWMLPTDDKYGGWAASGEIDIMEARGQVPNEVSHAMHYGGAWPNNAFITKTFTQPNIIDDFHVYGVEWERDFMRFLVDDKVTWEVDLRKNWWTGKGPNPYSGTRQPWDQRFHFILNVAVGGNFFGDRGTFNVATDPSTWSRPELTVDWVKVYQKQ